MKLTDIPASVDHPSVRECTQRRTARSVLAVRTLDRRALFRTRLAPPSVFCRQDVGNSRSQQDKHVKPYRERDHGEEEVLRGDSGSQCTDARATPSDRLMHLLGRFIPHSTHGMTPRNGVDVVSTALMEGLPARIIAW